MSTHHHRDINTILDNTKVEGFPIYTWDGKQHFLVFFISIFSDFKMFTAE